MRDIGRKLRTATIFIGIGNILSGCPSADTPPPDPVPISYETLSSTAATTSKIEGVGIRSGPAGLEVVQQNGTLTHDTGELILEDDTYVFVDPDGFSNGVARDDLSGVLVENSSLISGIYDYVLPVTFSYVANGTPYTTTGFIGISTDPSHIPVTGTASYSGDAFASLATLSQFTEFVGGTSSIVLDFSTGLVDVSLGNFDGNSDLLDQITITGMTISGNTISGGTIATLLNGSEVNLIGSNIVMETGAIFYGWDDTSEIPDEVAGIGIATGDGGVLMLSFIAD